MKTVYEEATRVLAWLGPDTEGDAASAASVTQRIKRRDLYIPFSEVEKAFGHCSCGRQLSTATCRLSSIAVAGIFINETMVQQSLSRPGSIACSNVVRLLRGHRFQLGCTWSDSTVGWQARDEKQLCWFQELRDCLHC